MTKIIYLVNLFDAIKCDNARCWKKHKHSIDKIFDVASLKEAYADLHYVPGSIKHNTRPYWIFGVPCSDGVEIYFSDFKTRNRAISFIQKMGLAGYYAHVGWIKPETTTITFQTK